MRRSRTSFSYILQVLRGSDNQHVLLITGTSREKEQWCRTPLTCAHLQGLTCPLRNRHVAGSQKGGMEKCYSFRKLSIRCIARSAETVWLERFCFL